MTRDQAVQMTKDFEGYSGTVYLDSLGIPTIGYGFALKVGARMPGHILDELFNYKYSQALQDFVSLDLDLDPVRRAVVVDMIYNLGFRGFLGFKKAISAMRRGDWKEAARQMLDSKWASQVGDRAVKLAKMMETGCGS